MPGPTVTFMAPVAATAADPGGNWVWARNCPWLAVWPTILPPPCPAIMPCAWGILEGDKPIYKTRKEDVTKRKVTVISTFLINSNYWHSLATVMQSAIKTISSLYNNAVWVCSCLWMWLWMKGWSNSLFLSLSQPSCLYVYSYDEIIRLLDICFPYKTRTG